MEVETFDALRVGLATADDIRSWSHGEVKKPETINYRTLKPEKDGLFCEKIFGPTKDWECSCGKYKRVRFKGIVCERCGVEVTKSSVRRERMGHIELAAPVTHIWYFKGVPSRLGYLLNMAPKDLEKIIYFAAHRVMARKTEEIEFDRALIKEDYLDRVRPILEERDAEIQAASADEITALKEFGLVLQPAANLWEAPEFVDIAFVKSIEQLVDAEEKSGDASKISKKAAAAIEESEEVVNARSTQDEKEIKKLLSAFKKNTEKIIREYGRRERRESLQREQLAWRLFLGAKEGQLVQNDDIFDTFAYWYGEYFDLSIGAEAVHQVLAAFDLAAEAQKLRDEIAEFKGTKQTQALKRLKVVQSFIDSNTPPTSMVLSVLPVLPPEIRPMVQLDGGRFATSDLNDLYRRVINRNNRLKRFIDLGAVPQTILNNEKRMLQEAVDALFDNGRRGRPVTGTGNRALKSLSDLLKGKQGRFRQNLLGKRVDYSGRSVIVVGPQLKLHQCGLPKLMALELFKPFVMKRLVDLGLAQNIKSAKRMVERSRPQVWGVLEEVIRERPVLLNRAPTLHRLGIQAFEPLLVEGKAIQLHPLVCSAFNADFDGDQMAVHLPLSVEAQAEARLLMLASNNILKPSDGRPVAVPTQDMIIGLYHLTDVKEGALGEGKAFNSVAEARMAFDKIVAGKPTLDLNAKITIRFDGLRRETTLGRALFNQTLPEGFAWVEQQIGKKEITKIITDMVNQYERVEVAQALDRIKDAGFYWATRSGVSMSISDVNFDADGAFEKKRGAKILEGEKAHTKIQEAFDLGMKSDLERRDELGKLWNEITKEIQDDLQASLPKANAISKMVNSGARGNWIQIRSIMGMRGPVATSSGDFMPMPIKGNYLIGLTANEYFVNATGARKGNADTAMKTAAAGYLTRRLVDVAQDVIVRIADCGTTRGLEKDLTDKNQVELSILHRTSLHEVADGKNVIVEAGGTITQAVADRLVASGKETIQIRSVLTCEAPQGVCAKCYGISLATGDDVELGEAIGIIAAQSIGEPGTQLTMRTFHTGGAAEKSEKQVIKKRIGGIEQRVEREISYDITQGLTGVTDLLEARIGWNRAAKVATMAFWSGRVQIHERDVLISPAKARILSVESKNSAGIWESKVPGEIVRNVRILTDTENLNAKGADLQGRFVGYESEYFGTVESVSDEEILVVYSNNKTEKYSLRKVIGSVKNPEKLGKQEVLVKAGDSLVPGQLLASGIVEKTYQEKGRSYKVLVEAGSIVEQSARLVESAPGVAKAYDVFVVPQDAKAYLEAETLAQNYSFSRTTSKTFKKLHPSVAITTVSDKDSLMVSDNEFVEAGDYLVDGTPIPHEVLMVKGAREAEQVIIKGIQAIYGAQGVALHDKHLEVIVRQMLGKVTVVDSGDTDMLPGSIIDGNLFRKQNREAVEAGKKPAAARQEVMGMTRASLAAQSWLSAASFQETTRVLTQAALDRKEDKLVGLKENVIIGKLIPAGTGLSEYRNISVEPTEAAKAEKYPNRIWAQPISDDEQYNENFSAADLSFTSFESYSGAGEALGTEE